MEFISRHFCRVLIYIADRTYLHVRETLIMIDMGGPGYLPGPDNCYPEYAHGLLLFSRKLSYINCFI